MLTQWFDDWVAEKYTPPGAEPFAELRERAVRAVNRALEHEAPVLVVAHGALFRALRSAMGLDPNFRTANGIPWFCEPGAPWTLVAATELVR
jgi:probable phosphoglycerate mutase